MQSSVAVDALRADDKLEGDALLADYVQRYRRLIERVCRILLADSGDVEDATQQTFLLAYQSLLAGTRPHHPRAWLCTIARRECWARDHRRRRERAVPQAEARTAPDPADQTVVRAELATINAGLEQLPTRQRQAIVLRELGGLSYTQLAATMEVSESAAEALLVRARRSLREARLVLVLLPFPGSLRRLLRLGSGHARTTVGVHAAKAVAVATLVTATTAVAGAVPVERAASPVAPIAKRSAPASRPVARTRQRPVSKPRAVAPHARRAHTAPASVPAVASAAPVRQTVPVSHGAAGFAPRSVSPAAVASTVAPPASRAAAPAPRAQTPKPSAPRPHGTAPKPKPPGPATTPTSTTPATPTPTETDPAVPPPPPDTPDESTPPPTDGSSGAGPGDPGDPKPGNGYGDDNHDHDGGHGKH